MPRTNQKNVILRALLVLVAGLFLISLTTPSPLCLIAGISLSTAKAPCPAEGAHSLCQLNLPDVAVRASQFSSVPTVAPAKFAPLKVWKILDSILTEQESDLPKGVTFKVFGGQGLPSSGTFARRTVALLV